ncbi:PREDICTED: pelargonidin 3-O-(6-caffeoylglucoside) 5-O-(6-O-malonylglucoside) 4'''-malonyltransferase-like [Erythranthe guttata]|uniref:pelargonidin 3-O-(6-caffeoylglucoside) 5-O-(6-O-malonylglucoside) 4'''-malonyltransferase-like n=1 Tax=Erythranthe guttata TaxID=4155 RepID=UPI00064DB772|nr:PREDICTED: pelargonidin 3-O-(6-caffeoylglucoside) 5-O-(6-O-malonylglucoside) 4'''-malonyltransferase-like [Erythranthe guttata]|eukprot:XP_012853626.1 PREDICTED: pelargonidin 3-O-(6-caffeoylglucoside) 5-O-(6-O-malonylglucoside) 4'''-malonyltransferase-like [Erythranthe guttata]
MNVGVILLYDNSISPNNPKQTTTHFQESLSKILPQFYPLAGRYIKKDHSVDCNDSGAEFVEAQVVDDDVTLSDVILTSKREVKLLNDYFLPPKFHQVDESPTDPLLSIRITRFKCGGLVVSVSVSHRIFGASSVGTFLAIWSNANKNPGMVRSIKIRPSFDTPPEFFPGNYISRGNSIKMCWDPNIVVKRFSFHKEAITSLRSKLRLPENSRVRVVSAVIADAMIGVDRAKQSGKSRACLIAQAVNMRRRTFAPLPKHSCRNWLILSPTRCMIPNTVVGNNNNIQELVDILGDGLEKPSLIVLKYFLRRVGM